MSHSRRIVVVRPIPKPEPFALDHSIFVAETQIKDRKILEKVLRALGFGQLGAGTVAGATHTIMVDLRVNADFGFRINNKTGLLECLTTGKAQQLIEQINPLYSYFTCIESLVAEGYDLKEQKKDGSTFFARLEKETGTEVKVVEITSLANGELGVRTRFHDDAEECSKVIDKATQKLHVEKVLENEKTYEYSKRPKKRETEKAHEVPDKRQRPHLKQRNQ